MLSEELTKDQTKALINFKDWLNKANDGVPFLLSGYAGSGKTFLSIKFLNLVEKKKLCWTSVAPTHKAVGVLHKALASEGLRPTWYPSTIHRLLRLKIKRKGDLEICEETKQTNTSLEQLGLVLIDEASMIDKRLLEIVLKCAYVYKTRIVFVGDSAQLPPVGEESSSVFAMKRIVKSELTEVIRNKGEVLELANAIRSGRIKCIQPPCIPIVKEHISSVTCLDSYNWLGKAKAALKQAAIEENPDSARILCYTNRSLERLVPHARRAIHGEMADQLPVLPGEVLITRSAVMAPASNDGGLVGEEPDMVLGANRELVVLDVKPESCDLADFGLASFSEKEIPIIKTLVVRIRSGELELSLRLLPQVNTQPRKLLEATLQSLKNKAKDLHKEEARNLWRKYFLIRDAFASLGPASVLTIHRSQGSTFGDVFITSDVFWPKDLLLRRQLVYVAISRASNSVCLLANERKISENSTWSDQFDSFIKN